MGRRDIVAGTVAGAGVTAAAATVVTGVIAAGAGIASTGSGTGGVIFCETSCTRDGAGALRASGDLSTAEITSRLPLVGASVSDDADDAASRSLDNSLDGFAGPLHAASPAAVASVIPASRATPRFVTTSSAGSNTSSATYIVLSSTQQEPWIIVKESTVSGRSFERFSSES